MILFNVIGWQRALLGISLAVGYLLFVSLVNFSPCHKANCLICVRGRSWGIGLDFVSNVQQDEKCNNYSQEPYDLYLRNAV